ncbi:MAG: NHLP bacteriocin system secretion protein [Synechococcales bacterium]|nr:NHLP bacteriocin system secretion protein [Synechococcales bacterium]
MVVQLNPANKPESTQPNPAKNQLFRQKALDHTASPEQLDLPIQIISPKRWLSLLALGGLVTVGAAWSVFGRIPITVSGKGVLIYPSQVMTVQSPSAGRIAKIEVKIGDRVTKGQVIARIDQSELKQQLDLARNKLLQLQLQDQSARYAQLERERLDRTATEQQRQALRNHLQTVRSLTPELRTKGLDSIQQERRTLQEKLQNLERVVPVYQQQWDSLQQLAADGAYPRNEVIKAEQAYLNTKTQISEAQAQLKQLDTKEASAQRDYLTNLNQANEYQAKLKELDTKSASQSEQDLASGSIRQKEMQETERSIAQLELQLQQNTQLLSEYDGYVQELNVSPGQRIETGAGIGAIAAHKKNAKLMGVIFLPVGEGKKIDDQMIKKGIEVQITPAIVKREEYGGIIGKVTEVAKYPVTEEAATRLVGNPAILPEVMEKGAYITVFTELQQTIDGKFRWSSSQGPSQTMTPGTTTTANVTIEERAPISYVIPLLKSLTGQ